MGYPIGTVDAAITALLAAVGVVMLTKGELVAGVAFFAVALFIGGWSHLHQTEVANE